jgi:hypothetical protein
VAAGQVHVIERDKVLEDEDLAFDCGDDGWSVSAEIWRIVNGLCQTSA